MLNIVIFGGPGSGKGTQSDLLKAKYNLTHISTGEVLRDIIQKQTELGKTADSYISRGQLVPDSLIISILAEKMDELINSRGVIFDGFPRTIPQAVALEEMLQARGKKVSGVVALEVEQAELIDRLVKRGEISGRSDDNPETIKKRLEVYETQTSPLIDYYKKENKYHGIHGMGSIEEIFGRITAVVDNL